MVITPGTRRQGDVSAALGLAPFVDREVQSAAKAGSVRMDVVRRFAEDPMLGQKPLGQWDAAGLL
jgi:hypothetical protein